MKNLIFVLAAMLLFSCSNDDDKGYELPPIVPEEVQADNFRLIREDFALLYKTFHNQSLDVEGIQIDKVECFEYEAGYALSFTGNYPNGDVLQFVAASDDSLATGTTLANHIDARSGLVLYAPYDSEGSLGCREYNGELEVVCVGGPMMLGWNMDVDEF